MDWITLSNLILTVGLPAAEKLWQLATASTAPTQADWDSLKVMANAKARDLMAARLTAAGIALDSEQGKAMLALAS